MWIYNSVDGTVDSVVDPVGWVKLKSGMGWHGPFTSQDETLKYYEDNKSKNPGWKKPIVLIGSAYELGRKATNATVDTVKGVIADPLGKFNLGGWFLRIGEILLGLVLIGVGVAKLTGTANVVSKAVKVGALL